MGRYVRLLKRQRSAIPPTPNCIEAKNAHAKDKHAPTQRTEGPSEAQPITNHTHVAKYKHSAL